MNENQAEFKGWAKVEVMGHQSHIGYVTTEAYGQAVLFRIDRPEVAECEQTLEETEWVGDQRCPAGTIVKHGKLEADLPHHPLHRRHRHARHSDQRTPAPHGGETSRDAAPRSPGYRP